MKGCNKVGINTDGLCFGLSKRYSDAAADCASNYYDQQKKENGKACIFNGQHLLSERTEKGVCNIALMATDKNYNVEKGRVKIDSALFECDANAPLDHF